MGLFRKDSQGGQLFSHLVENLLASRKDLKLAPHKARDHLVRPSLLEEETGDRQNMPERVGFHTRQRNDADGNVDCDAAVGEAALSSRGSHETRARSCQLDTAKAAFLKTDPADVTVERSVGLVVGMVIR